MKAHNLFLQTYKPGIPKRYLLIVAAIIWTLAGGMLLFRGFLMLRLNSNVTILEESGCVIVGIVFYKLLFSGISLKHINRILNLQIEKPCFFSFFAWRSYILMAVMIGGGITLRWSGLVLVTYLSLFYVAMGTPLFISAIRFYYYFYSTKLKYKPRETNN